VPARFGFPEFDPRKPRKPRKPKMIKIHQLVRDLLQIAT